MRWTVRETSKPFDPVGYVDAPLPSELANAKFRHSFRMSRWMNDHPKHLEETTSAFVVLEVGMYSQHGQACRCGACPVAEACFMSNGHPIEVLRRIVGFHPVTVLRAAPASTLTKT